MNFLQRELDQLEKLASAVSLLETLSRSATAFANGPAGQLLPEFRACQLTEARRRLKGAQRLRKRIATLASSIESKMLETIT